MLQDGSAYVLELRPKTATDFQAKLIIHAVATPKEQRVGHLKRKLLIKPQIHRPKTDASNYQTTFDKDLEEAFFVSGDPENNVNEKLQH